ncbi:MAG TPA: 1-(5-phosphoribosyl)-5-[(5-phosphoribosylamino)methylideneamino]imidazole-4-carboxamide isomerase [Spirochaetota bacterium]|nr:1-(5-phosphoribosyl)-5-[(5-phosphoribosylamino)methylideneamino]imidazole-4-carboxamide isomerase [Spirochaetota bacterium]
MIIIPAIDLIDGKCVRLTEGDFARKKVYDENPIDLALKFKDMGAKRLHLIDLDGAKSGFSVNRQIIKKIKKETGLTIQTGGGIRTEEDVQALLFEGIDYLILGSILAEKLDVVAKWIENFGEYFIAAVDVKDNALQTRGWLNNSGEDAISFGKKLFQAGLKTAVYTDISKDGKLEGPNIEDTKKFSSKTGLRVILSGGVSCEEDIISAKTLTYYGLTGVVVGKAIYEERINLQEIIKKYQD